LVNIIKIKSNSDLEILKIYLQYDILVEQ